jgi:hypothetical protein
VSSDETIHTIKPLINPIITINSTGNRALLTIHPNGTVTGEIEDASEAARVFVDHIRHMIAEPHTNGLRDQLLQECLVKLRDVQGTQAPKQYACNLIKRIERVLQGQSK